MSLIRKILENENEFLEMTNKIHNLEKQIKRLNDLLSTTMKSTLICIKENKQINSNYQKVNSEIEKLKSKKNIKKRFAFNNEYRFIYKR
ncbi:MAG: hypothetical protein U9N59_10350 [Campylobacterota bacterium]|nr:hypothetical protein [Campylobacterota bacterium]